MSIVGAALLCILFLLFVGICVFFYRRCFARRTKASSTDAARTELGKRQAKIFNDLIDWFFSEPRRGVNEWSDIVAKSLTQQAAKIESREDFELRIEKISNFETPPQLSNISTRHSVSEKSLVATAEVLCKRFELNLRLTPDRRTTHDTISSIEPQVIIFEFQSLVEGLLLSSDNVTVLTAKFPTEPKMRLEVKQRQEGNIDIAELERLVRQTISGTEFRFPIPTLDRSSSFSSAALEAFELQSKTRTALAASEPLDNRLAQTRKKLLVRIIKASGLVTSQEKDYGSHQPFCVASMDSPAQSHTTSSVKNTTNPFFDEEFVFDLDQMTKTLTFEVRDKDRPERDNFLGLAILTADDFSRSRHVLPLTGKGPLTFGALVVQVSVVDSSQVPTILAASHNVQYMAPPAPPVVLVSDADSPSSISSMEASTRIPEDFASIDLKTLRDSGSLPPKGDVKRKSLVGAIKRRFQRKKVDSRSQSADRTLQGKGSSPSPSPQPMQREGLYLTPPPSRASTNIGGGGGGGGDSESVGHRSRSSSSLRRNLGRLFRRNRRDASPPSMPSGGGLDHSPRSSVGPPSPRLDPGPPNRQRRTPSPSSGLIPTDSENRLI